MFLHQRCIPVRICLRLSAAVNVPSENHCLHILIPNTTFITSRKLKTHACNQTECNPRTLEDKTQSPSSESHLDEVKRKLLFNSVLESRLMKFGRVRRLVDAQRAQRQQYKKLFDKSVNDVPLALKYLPEYNDIVTSQTEEDEECSDEEGSDESLVQLPYKIAAVVDRLQEASDKETDRNLTGRSTADRGLYPANWMTDYDVYDDAEGDGDERPWQLDYGTTDPTVPVTRVPCGGCGALLHCQDTAIPGYLPSEILSQRSKSELRALVCQRCHFLRHYDTALAVNVAPHDYPRILSQIREKRALVLLLVDLMDVPCSIWPNILDIIGTKRPVVVVGNKVDLLPQDSRGFLNNIKEVLTQCLETSGLTRANIKHVALISARTGFGVDQLITKMHNEWEYKGDVYLVGCTNTGKSTLFNALLQSDYCKVQAVDLVQRATTSPWPGTTLNLLKFPILRPSAWRLHARTKRMIFEQAQGVAELRLRQHQLSASNRGAATLMAHIGRTFMPEEPVKEGTDAFSVGGHPGAGRTKVGIDERDEDYRDSRWCYDTPGTVHHDQVINMLTTEELMLTLPRSLLHPRTFSLSAGSTLLVAGLARLDLLQASKAIRLTVFASDKLPLTVCRTSDADQVYSELIGSELMAVPTGGAERMKQWPGLAPARGGDLRLVGLDWRRSCSDVVLSSAGWISVTPGPDMAADLRAWTPDGRGVHVRPCLLPYAVNHRGARIRRSPAYRRGLGLFKTPPVVA